MIGQAGAVAGISNWTDHSMIDLVPGFFKSPKDAWQHLQSDGKGGTELLLGKNGSKGLIDFIHTSKSQIHPDNFIVGGSPQHS